MNQIIGANGFAACLQPGLIKKSSCGMGTSLNILPLSPGNKDP